MIKKIFMLATSLCLLNVASQANDNLDDLLLRDKDRSSYQLTSSNIPKDYKIAAAEIDEIFRKENKVTDQLSKKIELYASGKKPRPDITLFLLIHMAKKVEVSAFSSGIAYPSRFVANDYTAENTLRQNVRNYLFKHFEVTPVYSFMPKDNISHFSLCEELKECVSFLSGRHGCLKGMNTPGYKDTIDNEVDREIYSHFLNTEEQLLDFLLSYDSLTGLMVSNVNFKSVLQNLPYYQLYSMDENKSSFVRYYSTLGFFSIGFNAVKHSDFLYSFLYDDSPKNWSSFSFMNEFLQRKSKVYEKAEIVEEYTIERLRLKLADLTGKEENSSFDRTYAALLEQYGLSQKQSFSQDLIEKEKSKCVLKLALATSASEKLKEKSRDIKEQLETLNIIKAKFTMLLTQGQGFRNNKYYTSYNPRSPYKLGTSYIYY